MGRAANALAAGRERLRRIRGRYPLRFVLLWPFFAYRDRVRRSLRWRLAESHVGTILISVLAISLVGAIAAVTFAFVRRPMAEEPATEAKLVAESLEAIGWADDLSLLSVSRRIGAAVTVVDDRIAPTGQVARQAQTNVSALLSAMSTGTIGPNILNEDVNLRSAVGKQLANISSISVVGPDQRVIASSEPLLIGRDALLIGPAALGVARLALDNSTSAADNTQIVEGIGSITGAYPLKTSSGRIIGAVVVDKSARTLPTGLGIVGLMLRYVSEIALTLAILIGIPAIPIGTLIGLRRARAIGKPITELAMATDAISEQRFDARVRVEGEDEIALLGGRFNQMADHLQAALGREASARARAERLLAANQELVANVSHELRTPVALVRAHIESLANEPDRIDEYSRIALRETHRLESLVNDLFQLARLENQAVPLAREAFDAGGAVREAAESLREPARREAGIMMAVDVERGADAALMAVGDRARLVQVVQNLIRNAIRYTPEGGIILVGARLDGETVEMTVRDTGVGIAPKDLPHVFERFYRGERSRNRSHGGAGIGLAIARRLVEGMNGTIAVESHLGEGTVFTIHLPRADATASQETDAAPENVSPRRPAADGKTAVAATVRQQPSPAREAASTRGKRPLGSAVDSTPGRSPRFRSRPVNGP